MPVNFNNPVNNQQPVTFNDVLPVKTEKEVLQEILTPLPFDMAPTDSNPYPPLDKPGSIDWMAVSTFAPPSFGSSALASVVNFLSDQRRINQEVRYAEGMAIVDQMHEQADIMKKQAVADFALAMTSAVITIGASVTQVGMSVSALRAGGDAGTMMARNTLVQGVSGAVNGLASGVNGVKEFISANYNVAIKNIDANIEKCRTYISNLDSFADGLKETIRNAVSNQQAIQQSSNQAKTKIYS